MSSGDDMRRRDPANPAVRNDSSNTRPGALTTLVHDSSSPESMAARFRFTPSPSPKNAKRDETDAKRAGIGTTDARSMYLHRRMRRLDPTRLRDMTLKDAREKLLEMEDLLISEQKENEHLRSYQLVLEKTMKTKIAELELSPKHEEQVFKITQLQTRLQSALRLVQEKEGELHIAQTKNTRASETAALTREALEAISKQQDLGIQKMRIMNSQIETLKKQKSDLRKRSNELEIKLEAVEHQFGEVIRSVTTLYDEKSSEQANGDAPAFEPLTVDGQFLQKHELAKRVLEQKLAHAAQLEQENERLEKEIIRFKSHNRRDGSRGSTPKRLQKKKGKGDSYGEEAVEAWRQVENRDRIILAIKDEYERTIAENKSLQDTITSSRKSNEELLERLGVEVQRYMEKVKSKNRRIRQLEDALKEYNMTDAVRKESRFTFQMDG